MFFHLFCRLEKCDLFFFLQKNVSELKLETNCGKPSPQKQTNLIASFKTETVTPFAAVDVVVVVKTATETFQT